MGIIDVLSAGFSAVNKRLWVVSIPVFLDLFLWQGPKLTAAEPVKKLFDFLADLSAQSATISGSTQADAATQMAQMGEQFRGMNFLTLLAWQSPSVIDAQQADAPAGLLNMPVFTIDGGIALAGWVLGMVLFSLLFQSAYLGFVAHAIKAGESNLKFLASRVALNWARLIAYLALTVAAGLVLAVPILGLTALLSLLSPVLASLMAGLVAAIALWLILYLFFAVGAMFVSDVGPIRAIWYSFSIVRRYFWSALALIALILLIRYGVSRAWGLIVENPVGVTAAILGNAYVDAGLAAASMIYYREHFAKWRGSSEQSTELAQKA